MLVDMFVYFNDLGGKYNNQDVSEPHWLVKNVNGIFAESDNSF